MAYWQHYHTPATIEEAVQLLAQYDGRARVVGGGTDLILEMQQGHRPPVEALVDPTRITGLDRITEEDGYLVIGAGVTHTRIVADARLARFGTCLVESSGVIGGPQVRNVGTLAGNVAHALPAGDGTIGLLALDGEVQVASVDGLTWLPMAQVFLGPGQSLIDSTRMLLTRLRFRPTGPAESSAFRRVMRPQGVALPMIGMAVRLKLALPETNPPAAGASRSGNVQPPASSLQPPTSTIISARIAIGPAGPTPFTAEQAMVFLVGQPATPETFAAAAEIALAEANLRSSRHRATAEYRAEMIRVQLPKTLAKAAERAATGEAVPEGVGM